MARKITCVKSERGFAQYEKHRDHDGNEWYVCESSLATEPAIRLFITANPQYWPGQKAALHLTDEQARELARTIYAALRNHYQLAPNAGEKGEA